MKREGFWLVTTEHLKDKLWFRDEEDFKVGMNLIAVLSTVYPISICAFILMSNHVHFVLWGKSEDVEAFIRRFKKQYSQYYSHRYGSGKELLRDNIIDIQEVFIEDASFHRALAYVQMNCVAARICLYPFDYPWGTGDSFFRSGVPKGINAGSLSRRELERRLHSRTQIPNNFIFNENGFVNPYSYVSVKLVESIFRTPSRMRYFLLNSSKARNIQETPSFSDQVILSATKDLSISLFRKDGPETMDDAMKAELFKQIRYRFSCDINQISRIYGISYDDVVRLLDSY